MESVVLHDDPKAFLARAEAWLLTAEDRHNLILGLAYGLASGAASPDAYFATVEVDGEVVGCALRTPPHKLLVTGLPIAAVEALATTLADRYDHIPAVLGPASVAEAIAITWTELRGGGWRPGAEQRIYRLDEVIDPTGVVGFLREAAPADTPLAVAWGEAFARETGVWFANADAAIRSWIEKRQLFVWDDDGARSIAVAHGRTPRGIRVGYVYTPPASRGQGYASGCVAGVSREMLARDIGFCVLYTDLANPTSNAIYQRIGYYPIEDVRDFDLVEEGAF